MLLTVDCAVFDRIITSVNVSKQLANTRVRTYSKKGRLAWIGLDSSRGSFEIVKIIIEIR
jgi:hypothetical protein